MICVICKEKIADRAYILGASVKIRGFERQKTAQKFRRKHAHKKFIVAHAECATTEN
jgi:hypothetical protein